MNETTLISFSERRATLGTIKTSSERYLTKKQKDRPYGGRQMSTARLYAYGPSRNHVAIRTNDITM